MADNRNLKRGDQIEVHMEPDAYDWGIFLEYKFDGEGDQIAGYLVYEKPPVQIDDKVREVIKFVPIDGIKEVKRQE